MNNNASLTLFKNIYLYRLHNSEVCKLEEINTLSEYLNRYVPIILKKAKAAGVFAVEPVGNLQGEYPGKLDKRLRKLRSILITAYNKPVIKDDKRHNDFCDEYIRYIDWCIKWFRTALYYFKKSVEAKTRPKVELYEESRLQEFYFLMIYEFAQGFGWAVVYSDENTTALPEVYKLILEIDGLYNKIIGNKIQRIKSQIEHYVETCVSDTESKRSIIEAKAKSRARTEKGVENFLARSKNKSEIVECLNKILDEDIHLIKSLQELNEKIDNALKEEEKAKELEALLNQSKALSDEFRLLQQGWMDAKKE